MNDSPYFGPVRGDSPCRYCEDRHLRPACRKGCKKDEEWHKEVERVKSNRREHERKLGIRIK